MILIENLWLLNLRLLLSSLWYLVVLLVTTMARFTIFAAFWVWLTWHAVFAERVITEESEAAEEANRNGAETPVLKCCAALGKGTQHYGIYLYITFKWKDDCGKGGWLITTHTEPVQNACCEGATPNEIPRLCLAVEPSLLTPSPGHFCFFDR